MSARSILIASAFLCLALSQTTASPGRENASVLAEFRKFESWTNTDAEAAGRVSLLDTGQLELWVEVAPSSSAFKYFSEPHAILVVTDVAGTIIGQKYVTALAMGGYRNVDRRHRGGRERLDPVLSGNAAYAFFRLKFCAWRMGFDRLVHENNGCFKSSPRRELRELADQLPSTIGKEHSAGKIELAGWEGIRLRR